MTYKEQVEAFVGALTDTDALTRALLDGGMHVISSVRADVLYDMQAEFNGKGCGPPDFRVLGVTVDGVPARRVTNEEFNRASVSGSMYAPHKLSPIWSPTASTPHTIQTLPVGSVVSMSAVARDLGISCEMEVPDNAAHAWMTPIIVLYAAMSSIPAKIAAVISGLSELTFPDPLDDPAFTYTDAVATLVMFDEDIVGDLSSLTARFATAVTTIDDEEDIELASGILSEINVRINAYNATLAPYLAQAQQETALRTDVSKQNEAQELARQIQEYSASVSKYQASLQEVGVRLQSAQSEIGSLTALKRELEGQFALLLGPYLPKVQAQ